MSNLTHLRLFRHWPVWVRFDRVSICERCLKPPRRSNVPRPLRPVPQALH